MRSLLVAAALLFVRLCLAEQAAPPHQSTTLPQGARFEIVQSSIAARWTFRLDRYSGRIWQLVKTQDDENAWEETAVAAFIPIVNGSRARFQVFSSGLAARHTFLIDSDTGRTWVLSASKRKTANGSESEYLTWQPFQN